jgi:hypothetical protein
MEPGIDDEPAISVEEIVLLGKSHYHQRQFKLQLIIHYGLNNKYTHKGIYEQDNVRAPRYNHVLARANALRKHGHLLIVGGLKQYKWVGVAPEKEIVRDFMTPDFWKANLFLTNNSGGNDTLKANVAELKSLLTTSDGSSRVKMYASPRLIA